VLLPDNAYVITPRDLPKLIKEKEKLFITSEVIVRSAESYSEYINDHAFEKALHKAKF
jgi:hypothetical protein